MIMKRLSKYFVHFLTLMTNYELQNNKRIADLRKSEKQNLLSLQNTKNRRERITS